MNFSSVKKRRSRKMTNREPKLEKFYAKLTRHVAGKENGTRTTENGSDGKHIATKKRKKRKKEDSVSIPCDEASNEISVISLQENGRVDAERKNSGTNSNDDCQDFGNRPLKKKRHKRSKSSKSKCDAKSFETSPDVRSKSDTKSFETSSVINDENNSHNKSIEEMEKDRHTLQVPPINAQSNGDMSETNLDLLSLINQKKKQLAEMGESSKDDSTLDQNVSVFMNCDKPKRKRKRKRKKKQNGESENDVLKKDQNLNVNTCTRPKSSVLKLPVGKRPENTKLTFHSGSESEEESISCEEQVPTAVPVPIKRSSTNTSGQEKDAHVLFQNPSSRDSSSSKSLLLPDGLGKCLDPNSKFDELLLRRRLKGTNYSVGTLSNGAYVFTREKQTKGNNNHSLNPDHLHNAMTVPTVLPVKEVPGLKEVPGSKEVSKEGGILNALQKLASASSVPSPLQSPSDRMKYEVTPLYLDVERCPSLKDQPQPGDIIAYKVLELSDDYTPNLSDFKQGQVLSCEDGQIQIELFKTSVQKKKTGRFELVYEEEEAEEKDDSGSNVVSVELSEMVDARLVQKGQPKAVDEEGLALNGTC